MFRRGALIAIVLWTAMGSTAFAQDTDELPNMSPSPSPTPAPSPTPGPNHWAVSLFNGDDQIWVECNGKRLGPVAGFNQAVTVDLGGCLVPGHRNDFYIVLNNTGGGIAWGWRIFKNGQPAVTVTGVPAQGGCGKAGVVGCDGNKVFPVGIVKRHHYWFEY